MAVCSTLAMLLPANLPQAQAATTVQLAERNVKLSTFNGSDGVINSAFTDAQMSTVQQQVARRVLGDANVTRMVAVRVQFVRDNGSAYPWQANTVYHGGFSFKANPALSSLATNDTSQWHLVKVNGPQTVGGWVWNTASDNDIRNRLGTERNWDLNPTNAASIQAAEVQDAVTVDDSGDLVSAQDANMTWPGVYLLVETGTRDPAKSDNLNPGTTNEFKIKQTDLGNTNTNLLNRAKKWNARTLQYAAVRIQFVDSATEMPITSAPNSTFTGGSFRREYTLPRQATKATSKWTVLKLAAPSAQIANQWYWNTDSDENLLNRIANSMPVTVVANGAVTDDNGNLTAIKDDNVTQPAIYMAVETGTKDTGSSGAVKLPPATLPAGTVVNGTYYGFALQESIYNLGISTTAPNGKTPAQYAQAFCYNPFLPGPYLPVYAGKEYNVTYGEVMNGSGYLNLLDVQGQRLPNEVKNRLTGSDDQKGLQLKALVSKIFYDAYVLDGLGKYKFAEEELSRAVSIAVHRLVTSDEYLTELGYRSRQNITDEQWNAAGDLVQYALNQDPAPSEDQIQVKLFAATVKRAGTGADMQRLLTYRIPVQFDKVDMTTKQCLKGAHFEISDGNGTVVDGWDSDGSTIHAKFLDEGTYTLKETVVPEGYEAVSWAYQFKVDGNGRMTPVNEVADITAKQNLVTIGNTPKPEQPKQYTITISKVDGSNIAVVGAELALYRVENGVEHEIIRWTSDGNRDTFSNMDAGTYVLRELSAPDGYEKADDISFTIGERPARNAGSTEANTTFSEGSATVTMVDNKKTATFTSLPLTGMSSGLIAWIVVGVFLTLALASLLLAVLIKRRNQ